MTNIGNFQLFLIITFERFNIQLNQRYIWNQRISSFHNIPHLYIKSKIKFWDNDAIDFLMYSIFPFLN